MKQQSTHGPARRLDKHSLEAGLQCPKRLYLERHHGSVEEPSESRRAMSEVGHQLVLLARSAFPKGVVVDAQDGAAAAAETARHFAEGTPIVFGAVFQAEDVEVRCDIVLRQKTGELDLYEVKSGTSVKPRYLADLALQVFAAEQSGHKVRAVYVLHLDPRYVHTAGAEFPVQKLLKSADVTEKVRRQLARLGEQLRLLRTQADDEGMLALPMGTYCTAPFPCPFIPRCSAESPEFQLRELPELTRRQEIGFHQEGIEDLKVIDPKRPGLTFKQRRTLQAVQQGTMLVEPFVREELRSVPRPLHFLSIAGVVDALPRFDGQRPWRQVPYAWAAHSLFEDGRVVSAAFVHADKDDPRPGFVRALAQHVAEGGTILCWCDSALGGLRSLLDDLPAEKAAVRAVLARPHLDLMKLFDAGIHHPAMHGRRDLHAAAEVLLQDVSVNELPLADDEAVRSALARAAAPRIRAATKEKIAADVKALATWRSAKLLALYRRFAELAEEPIAASPADPTGENGQPAPQPRQRPQKQLPRE